MIMDESKKIEYKSRITWVHNKQKQTIEMARIKQTSCPPRLTMCSGKTPRMITLIVIITRELIDVMRQNGNKMSVVERSRETLRTSIATHRFYYHIQKYVKVIRDVGIVFDDMFQTYIRIMMKTAPVDTTEYYDMVAQVSRCMLKACDFMQQSIRVDDETRLSVICTNAIMNIRDLRKQMLDVVE